MPLKRNAGENRWDGSQLQLNNWFSSTTYYKVKSITDDQNVQVIENHSSNELTMARDILETEMHSGLIFDKQETLSRTKVLEKMMAAGETVFSVQFNKKVDSDHIKSVISDAGAKPDFKKLSKEILTGKECNLTCFLRNSDNQLGRSMVIDLKANQGANFRQIDHRTINSLVLKNVKYIVK